MEAQMSSSSLGAMGSLLAKLCSLLVSPEDQLPEPLKVHKDKLELLSQDLEQMNTFLVNLSWVEAPNMMVKHWTNEVRDLSYDIEDYIDKTMHPDPNTNEDPCSEVEELVSLVKKANDAHQRHNRYDLGRWASNPRFVVDGLNGEATDLVGIGDSKDQLINQLNTDAVGKVVVSIQGPVGVGKTTLAEEVYRQIGGQFQRRAFVRASKMPDTRRLLRSMIFQVQKQKHQWPRQGLTVQHLIDYLRQLLQKKRYLIVIDGLWETTSWDIIHSAFPDETNSSRVLVTTDIEEVALECCDYESDCIFKMGPLSRNDARELFFNRAFGSSNHECSEQLKEVSEEIIRKCCGLPLATICIARTLASQPDSTELWNHTKECLSCDIRNNLTSEDMLRQIICLSYNSLPHHLKTCLLYLHMYPEGYMFLKTDLVKQWAAEGFICAVAGKNTSEIAEFYFDELVYRGFMQPNCINFSDEVMFYTVHSTIFEVIRCKSMEGNFSTVIDYSESSAKLSAKVRRLSMRFSNAKYATKLEGITLSPVRSLIFHGLVECLPSIMEFEVLRVLSLDFWGDHEDEWDLSAIDRLFQLRYLWISTNITVKLPTTMKALQYLETLEIYAKVTTVPTDIVNLPTLQHLCLYGHISLPDGIAHLRSLRTLQFFDLSSNSEDNVRSLAELKNLRLLHLTCSVAQSDHLKRNLIALVSSFGKMGNLNSLVLTPGASRTSVHMDCSNNVSSPPVSLQILELLPPICIFSRLPKWIGQLRNLRILKVVVTDLLRDDVDIIIELQELTNLSLCVRKPTRHRIIFKSATFPALKYFKFRCGVLDLAFHAKAMPSLQKLKLEFNAHRDIPYGGMLAGIEHLLNLQEVAVRIGAGGYVGESDRMVVESDFMDTISTNSELPRINMQWVDLIDEETSRFSDIPAGTSRLDDEKYKWPWVADGLIEELFPFSTAAGSTDKLVLPKHQAAPESERLAAWSVPPFACQKQPAGNQQPGGTMAAVSAPSQTISSDSDIVKATAPPVHWSNMLSESQNQLADDGYNWRKYGQKPTSGGSQKPRSYYKCTFPNCPAKKKVQRLPDGQTIQIVYKGMHNHDKQPQNTRRGSATVEQQLQQSGGASEASAEHTSGGTLGITSAPVRSPLARTAGYFSFNEQEMGSKRLRKDSDGGEGISMAGDQTLREERIVFQTVSEVDILDDGYRWRKFGQMVLQENPIPRSYYKCAWAGCPVRKHVERASHDSRVVITTYEGTHNHDASGVLSGASAQGAAGGSIEESAPDGELLDGVPAAVAEAERHHARFVKAKGMSDIISSPSFGIGSTPHEGNSSGDDEFSEKWSCTSPRKGPWSPEEDKLLFNYIQANGVGNWHQLRKLLGQSFKSKVEPEWQELPTEVDPLPPSGHRGRNRHSQGGEEEKTNIRPWEILH